LILENKRCSEEKETDKCSIKEKKHSDAIKRHQIETNISSGGSLATKFSTSCNFENVFLLH